MKQLLETPKKLGTRFLNGFLFYWIANDQKKSRSNTVVNFLGPKEQNKSFYLFIGMISKLPHITGDKDYKYAITHIQFVTILFTYTGDFHSFQWNVIICVALTSSFISGNAFKAVAS